ncbi:hypothetical protein RND81_11G233600 [Saponaria officinalis]|uniref:RING-type E3 ubiquitin transferase n=1 Tax=Saponaria officinalis TaxID=3572 RepID=A0AAW1HPX7_SAPOF
MDTIICRGRTDCTAFGVFIAIVFTVIFLNYIQRCIQSQRNSSNLPLYNNNNNNNNNNSNNSRNSPNFPQNRPLSNDSPLYLFVLNSIPSAPYKSNSQLEKDVESCAICLGEFEKGEIVRVLPKCRHVYHEECIDKWLLRALHCPICRERVVDFQQHHRKNSISNSISAVDVRLNNNFPPSSVVHF